MAKKVTVKTIAADVLQKMRAEAGELVRKFVLENSESNSVKLCNLRRRYEETGGSGNLLLSKILPQRVKFYENGQYCNVSFIAAILGAGDYLIVYDCQSQTMRIQERPVVPPLEF